LDRDVIYPAEWSGHGLDVLFKRNEG
jgi:hypothetical protein